VHIASVPGNTAIMASWHETVCLRGCCCTVQWSAACGVGLSALIANHGQCMLFT
jgi:hypothetical protein